MGLSHQKRSDRTEFLRSTPSTAPRVSFGRWGQLALAACALSVALPASSAEPAGKTLQQACKTFNPTAPAQGAYMERPLPFGAVLKKTEYRKAGKGLPEACIVRGVIKSSAVSTISWAVELPPKKRWNGKSLTVGGGGFDGFIPTDDPWYHEYVMGPSSAAFVRISSNSGHEAQDFTWGSDEAALKNHAYEANHMVLHVGVKVAGAFYGEEPLVPLHGGPVERRAFGLHGR